MSSCQLPTAQAFPPLDPEWRQTKPIHLTGFTWQLQNHSKAKQRSACLALVILKRGLKSSSGVKCSRHTQGNTKVTKRVVKAARHRLLWAGSGNPKQSKQQLLCVFRAPWETQEERKGTAEAGTAGPEGVTSLSKSWKTKFEQRGDTMDILGKQSLGLPVEHLTHGLRQILTHGLGLARACYPKLQNAAQFGGFARIQSSSSGRGRNHQWLGAYLCPANS